MAKAAGSRLLYSALWLGLSVAIGCSGGSSDEDAYRPEETRWTVLVYMAADNELALDALTDLNEMEEVGSDAAVEIVAQVDLPQSSGEIAWTTCRRYRIEQDGDPAIGSTLLEDLGEVDMTDPDVLADFLSWGHREHPADRYLVVLWGHGDAWESEYARPESIFNDWSGSAESLMPNYLLREAMEDAGVHPDILAFDACVMGSLEAAFEFRSLAEIMISSQEVVYKDGYPYDDVLAAMAANPDVPSTQLASTIVSMYGEYYTSEQPRWDQTLSALDLNRMGEVAALLDTITGELLAEIEDSGYLDALIAIRNSTEDFTALGSRYVDLLDFARGLRDQLGVDVSDLESSVSSSIIAEFSRGDALRGHPNATGLSIYFPLLEEDWNADPSYGDYDPITGRGSPSSFMQFRWDNFLGAFFSSLRRLPWAGCSL